MRTTRAATRSRTVAAHASPTCPDEQDADQLSNLFQLDHLATRMRRNSENLLVLAGHEVTRRWSQPVPLVDVLRAAISEIEQYERVVLNVQPGIVVVGQAVNDVVHLVAEIVENATTFSPEDTQVYVSGQPLSSGGVLLDITDNGVGISDQEMSHANWRLDNPPVIDVSVSRHMGLFAVARLAERHLRELLDAFEAELRGAQIRRFLLLTKDLEADDAEMTRTRKVRRKFVAEKYAAVIDAFYSGGHEVELATTITYEDGRQASIQSRARIEDVERAPAHV